MNTFFKENKTKIDIEKILEVIGNNKIKYNHRNNQGFETALNALSKIEINSFNPTSKNISIIDNEKINEIKLIAKSLSHWRKGPYQLGDLHIDSEWRSDIKWNRLLPSLPKLENKVLLDIGCNNGYFMFEMDKQNPQAVLGIDPVVYCEAQFKFLQYFNQSPRLFFEMIGVDEVAHFKNLFDGIFNMGIIYHHPNPIEQLKNCHQALRKDGFIVLESITIPGTESMALFPDDRYARMRNVWFVPTANCMKNWLHKAKFKHIDIIYDELLTNEEQRVTSWSGGASLDDFLDPKDKSKTIEGHPAPRRAAIIAYK
jgi:tRNA (mo5U34)-methyltransferase